MGLRTAILRFCDRCNKELIGKQGWRTCPCCGKDVCLTCIEKEDALRELEDRLNPEGLTLVEPPKRK